ncbi:hypothetical protein ASC90_24245 [Rhizobium sp. Root1220]|nr:hypothetical protein ASC90_24245 [Rhizobium sp. Root1220]
MAAGMAFALPSLALGKNDSCGVRFDRLIQDGKLYVYNADGKGRWNFATAGRYDAPDKSLLFAYGIKGGRDNTGGMTLFKVVDVAKGTDIRNRDVRLSRTAAQIDVKGKEPRRVEVMNGKVDIQVYQDIHSNIKDINRVLNRFHTAYRYRAGENRDTFDRLRRKVFSFDEVKPIPSGGNWLALLLGKPAWAGIRSDEAIVGLRATLKYYENPDPRNGEVICFTVTPAEAAVRTQVTVVDLDFPGPYADLEEVLEGRKQSWKLVWNRKPDEQE